MKPTVYMMLGLTGSGKTTFARDLREKLLLDVLSLDAEYERQGGKLNNPKWDVAAASRAEEVINAKVREYVQSGESVILDFCFWLREGRMQYREFIKSIGAKCHVYYFELPIEELWKRLESRSDGQVVTREMLDDFVRRFQLPVDEKVELVLA
jgi:predicted kinase